MVGGSISPSPGLLKALHAGVLPTVFLLQLWRELRMGLKEASERPLAAGKREKSQKISLLVRCLIGGQRVKISERFGCFALERRSATLQDGGVGSRERGGPSSLLTCQGGGRAVGIPGGLVQGRELCLWMSVAGCEWHGEVVNAPRALREGHSTWET